MKPEEIKEKIHSLGSGKSGKIRFINLKDNKEHCFISTINRLTGCRMSYFDFDAPGVDDPVSWVKSVFQSLRNTQSLKILEDIGDF